MTCDFAVTTPQQHRTAGVATIHLRELLKQSKLSRPLGYFLLNWLAAAAAEEDLQDLGIDYETLPTILLLLASFQPHKHAVLDAVELRFRLYHFRIIARFVMEDATLSNE